MGLLRSSHFTVLKNKLTMSTLRYCVPLTIAVFLAFGCESTTAARLVKVRFMSMER